MSEPVSPVGTLRFAHVSQQEEALHLVLLLLTCRFCALDAPTTARIHALTVTQLEALALFDFATPEDLHTWLDQPPVFAADPDEDASEYDDDIEYEDDIEYDDEEPTDRGA